MPRPRKKSKERPSPDALGDEAKSVLAVLALASLWPARLEDGWVSVSQFGQAGLFLGERSERESLKAAIRRGLRDVATLRDPPLVEQRHTRERDPVSARLLKEEDRRLREPVPVGIGLWVLRAGGDFLVSDLWREFLAAEYRPALSLDEVTAGLEETVIRTLLGQGRHEEAIGRAREALARARTARERRPLQLGLAISLMRRGRGKDWKEAVQLLTDLRSEPTPIVDHHDRVTEARILLAQAYARFFLELRGEEPANERHRATAAEIRKLLEEAGAITSDLSLFDRGQVANLEGLLRKWEAQVEGDPVRREILYDQAERYLRQALTIWRLAHDAFSLGVALYNIGELKFSRYRLHRGFGEEVEIWETLVWYEASVRYTEMLGNLSEWMLDYGKAAECLALLIPHHVGRGETEICLDLLRRARAYLHQGAASVPDHTPQAKMFKRIGRLLLDLWQRHAPPLASLDAIQDG